MTSVPAQLKQWWQRTRTKDPYWDAFLHRPPADPRNIITPAIQPGPAGSVFPNKTDVHESWAMSSQIKELATFFGIDATGISAVSASGFASSDSEAPLPFAISCLVAAVEEVRESTGIGGQFASQKCATANFNIASYIRELGYRADVTEEGAHARAAAAGLGRLDPDGRLTTKTYGRRVAIAGVILTDLPLKPD